MEWSVGPDSQISVLSGHKPHMAEAASEPDHILGGLYIWSNPQTVEFTPCHRRHDHNYTPFTAWSSCCLNFSVDLCLIFLLFTASHGHFPPRHCGRCPQASWLDCSLFSGPQNNLVFNNRHPPKMAPGISTPRYGEWCSCSLLQCWPATQGVSLSLHLPALDLRLARTVGSSCG
jgi:hypothetical protein